MVLFERLVIGASVLVVLCYIFVFVGCLYDRVKSSKRLFIYILLFIIISFILGFVVQTIW